MKQFFRFTWLPIVMAAIIVVIFGGSSLAQAQKQNRILENKIDQLTKRIDSLEVVRVAGTSTENQESDNSSSTKLASSASSKSEVSEELKDNNIQPTPTSTPTPTAIPKPKPKPTPIPTVSLTPTPTPTPVPQKLMTVEIQDIGNYQVELKDNETAFSVLLRASGENNFTLDYQNYEGLGVFVNCIASICGLDNYYWAFYYNGQYSMVGASSQPVSAGDITAWKFETW